MVGNNSNALGKSIINERIEIMFSVEQKRKIADQIQKILQETNHPELPVGEIQFFLHVCGEQPWSFADIMNNGAIDNPTANPWNEVVEEAMKKAGLND